MEIADVVALHKKDGWFKQTKKQKNEQRHSHVRKHFLISNLLCDNIVQQPATGTLWQ